MGIFSDQKDILGIDIGTTAIRVVQVKNNNNTQQLVTYGSIPVDQRMAQSDSQEDRRKVGEALNQLLSDANVTTKSVVSGLPTNKTYSSVVTMPKMNESEMDKSVKYQADQYIPKSLDEVKLDWTVVGTNPKGENEVLLVAAPHNTTEARFNLLESLDLDVVAIEPDGVALGRSLVSRTNDVPVIILDVGAQSSDLVIMYQNTPRLMRTIPIGGNTFIKSAEQNLNVDQEQAQQFVYKFGLTKTKLEGQVYRAIETSAQNLVDEVEKSYKFFKGRYQDVNVEKIVLTGGASSLPEFPLFIANNTSLPVEIGNSWLNMTYPGSLQDTLMGISSQFSVAAGLALREGE